MKRLLFFINDKGCINLKKALMIIKLSTLLLSLNLIYLTAAGYTRSDNPAFEKENAVIRQEHEITGNVIDAKTGEP
ncbi:MAG: hypothetical protein JSV22_12710, partial [Bacteroidales bacterium]